MRHFSHELKCVLRDFAVLLALPTLIVAGTLYFWTAEWAMETAPPGASTRLVRSLLATLVQPVWPYLEKALRFGGWAIPFLVLKNADLHDTLATWKTRPVSRQTVFTARFLALLLALVALPAATTWLIVHLSWPEIAAVQAAKVAGGGFGMILLGAFAAMIAPGYRGLAILGGLAASAYAIASFGPDLANWILHRHVLHLAPGAENSWPAQEYKPLTDAWMALATLLAMVALVTPWIVLRILRVGRQPRVLPWFVVTILLGVAFQSALFLSPARKTAMLGPVLPVATLELKDINNRPTPIIESRLSGPTLGAGNLRLPAADLSVTFDNLEQTAPLMWVPAREGHPLAHMTGTWNAGSLHGRVEEHFEDTRAGLSATWYENEWGGKPAEYQDHFGDYALRPLATTLGVPAVKIWTALNCSSSAYVCNPREHEPHYAWVDSATFRQKPQLVGFEFGIPFGDSKPGEPCVPVTPEEAFRDKTIRFRVDMQLVRDLPPSVWLRMPVLHGGEKVTDREMVRIEPAEPADRRFYFKARWRELPKAPWSFASDYVSRNEIMECLLFNAARGEGVFLVTNNVIHKRKGLLTLPMHAPELTDEWIAGAEIVVLKYRSEPVVLPVEGSLKVAD